VITLTLPYPPSSNRYWRHSKNGKPYVSEEAKAYKSAVFYAVPSVLRNRLITGELAVTFKFYRPLKSGDLSNRIKILEDALQGVLFNDDKQIIEIHAFRFDDKESPRVEIEISPK
jgi:crossover junction endodeoxyribonuclease RusA